MKFKTDSVGKVSSNVKVNLNIILFIKFLILTISIILTIILTYILGHTDFAFAEDGIIIVHSQRNFPVAADIILFW